MAKTEVATDTYLVGIGVSPGISIGEINLLSHSASIDEWPIAEDEIAAELERFQWALQQAREQLLEIKASVSRKKHLREHLYILDTHLLILEDEMLVQGTEKEIQGGLNSEGALKRTLRKLRQMFENIEDEYLRDRSSDVDAVGSRLMRILTGENERSIADIGHKALVVAHDLSPAETMQMDREKVLGFVTDKGGQTSHTAILARSLEIPAVVGLETITSLVHDGLPAIIDGSNGIVILKPSEETFKEYLKRKQSYEYLEKELHGFRDLPAITTDNVRVTLRGNLEMASEFPVSRKHGTEGVGLYRTEFLYLGHNETPSEEEQIEAYREILTEMQPESVTIRTLDCGGDKIVSQLNVHDEANPAMGLRGIRFSLSEGNLFRTQLRAILRASVHGKVRIMFPMISGVVELQRSKRILREVQLELTRDGHAFDPDIEIGIMIETPSAVLLADVLAEQVDFFSIGTNDLIQYCLAVDRGNEHVAYLYEPLHPAILKALQMVCRAANNAGIDVCLCGEMAGEPIYALVLLGLGLHELSMNPGSIPRVKRVIRRLAKSDGEVLLQDLQQLQTAKEVSSHLDRKMRELLPDIFDQSLI
ncbi:phosphoenolpyruvate--protein phosphotransferase [Malonomonas rubra DSM 5091]|uniref:Phosphoenolpyruvate-protein phosphotransferase n=1 Tax=Malonomonas rubra DSM 5091 TaxID=1122189 RepID=A0A1M6DX82_MALRU|nr:phosphoenolpyruvate--protein phosphotransferase [Malonomonas rubra]SHI77821.1 phosphoenolpyruvate--protein phosphotransferase [Malonomonas rubra DSM 5091]